jgi:hypothetical protein
MIIINVVSDQASYELRVSEKDSFKKLKEIYKAYTKRRFRGSFLNITIESDKDE